MKTIESKIKDASSLSFSHNRDGVDVFAWNTEGEKIITIRNCSSDLFLSYFEFGTTIYDPNSYQSLDNKETLSSFLKQAI